MYTNAEMEYRAADSTIISTASRGLRLAPGIRDTVRTRKAIITVDSTVVTTDNVYELSSIALQMLSGMLCGITQRPNNVIPRAEGVYPKLICPQELLHTYRTKIEAQREDGCHPTTVAYDPAPPDLQIKDY
jgi:hypothetical protein